MKLSIGNSNVTVGGSVVNTPVELSPITISGADFIRNGAPYKVFGFQMLSVPFDRDYYTSETQEYRDIAEDYIRGNRSLGANVERLHIQLWDFIEGESYETLSSRTRPLENLVHCLDVARDCGTSVLISGCTTWHIDVIPAWFDALTNEERWDVYAFYWDVIAKAVVDSGHRNTVFAYELMNEPSISTDPNDDWYFGDTFGIDVYFGIRIARGVPVEEQAQAVRDWVTITRDAIKAQHPETLVSFANYPFMYSSPFGVANTSDLLDYITPHIYPPPYLADPPKPIETVLSQAQSWIDLATAANIPLLNSETFAWAIEESDNAATFDAIFAGMQGNISFGYGYPRALFTRPPEVPRPPADPVIADIDPTIYSRTPGIMEFFLTYRAAFIAENID